jgi:crotonobetainyl-CoA:carnitine CoA-transferase CaiB-like acyl-CoA transferase
VLPLENLRVLTLAVNLPGPLAAAELQRLGAAVVKVEPPQGDPLNHALPDWYAQLHEGIEIIPLDLKTPEGRAHLEPRLAASDLLLTATRPAALARLGLAWDDLHGRHVRLCHVAIVGYPPPHEDRPGHDLNYQARAGLLVPPQLPRTCAADLAGAERVVSAALALLLARQRGQLAGYASVSLADVAEDLAAPLRQGLTAPGGALGGGRPGYGLYRARTGWVALAALEPHFFERLTRELSLSAVGPETLAQAFLARTAAEWETWAQDRDLPLTAVHIGEEDPA